MLFWENFKDTCMCPKDAISCIFRSQSMENRGKKKFSFYSYSAVGKVSKTSLRRILSKNRRPEIFTKRGGFQ